jgi:hypothetical protein
MANLHDAPPRPVRQALTVAFSVSDHNKTPTAKKITKFVSVSRLMSWFPLRARIGVR